nr:sulfatase-like hydrolase/transferase [Microbacterium fandaimingii]
MSARCNYGPEGPGDRGTPPRHGFDESFYGLAGQSMGRLHYLTHSREAMSEFGDAAEAMAVQPMWSGDQPADVDRFLTDEFSMRADDFISRDRESPFFAMVAFNAVHNFCWQLPHDELEKRGLPALEDWHPGASEYLDWYDGAISPNLPNGRAYYLAQLELMDAQIGHLLTRLDALGIADDTIVVYLTDNGGSTCNYGDNGELRGTKYTLWEGGVRVPFLMRWPGLAEAGATSNQLVSSLDLATTFAVAAGEPQSENLDGRDLAPVLAGGAGHEVLHWDCGWQWAVREGQWKLSWCDAASETAQYIIDVEHTSPGDGAFLCDLETDIGETTNVAAEHPEIVDRLARAHDAWRTEIGLVNG